MKLAAKMLILFVFISIASASDFAHATETGGSIYPNGNENFMSGAMPPPGVYSLLYAEYFSADILRDKDGNKVPVDFNLKVHALSPRFVWVTDHTLFGGQLALHTIIPLLDIDVQVGAGRDTETGLGDIVIGPALGYHVSDKLHYVLAIDINMPTGSYDKTAMANTSRNYWNIEPVVAITYVQLKGVNADLKVMYDFNFENDDTDYTSGQELHADYALGWGFGNGWVAGIGGYVYQQITDDTQNGNDVADNKGRAMAMGPSVKYDNGKGFFITLKWQEEAGVLNRAEGHSLKLKMTLPI
ncbi:MAG: transporter [Proteobacteria bacterium]|nr:transporter [Pseudomonadota bacterium]